MTNTTQPYEIRAWLGDGWTKEQITEIIDEYLYLERCLEIQPGSVEAEALLTMIAQRVNLEDQSGGSMTMQATWMLVDGPTTAQGVDPLYAGIDVPDEVLAWAERHGYHPDNPSTYLLVVPSDAATGDAPNEIAYMVTEISSADAQRLRDADHTYTGGRND